LKTTMKNCGTKLNIIFSPFQHKWMTGRGSLTLNLLGKKTWLWEERKNFLSCGLSVNLRWDLLSYPCTSSGFPWKKSILPFTGKQ
jgi:hypothetical protein